MKALITDHALPTRVINLLAKKSIGKGVKEADVDKPILRNNEILVKVTATALNPIDTKFIDVLAPPGNIAGCDFAGVVSDVAQDAPSTLKFGDRVAGFVQGGIETWNGAFAEYLNVEGDLVWRIPESVSDEEAATYGISAVTAMQALHLNLDVPWLDTPATAKKVNDTPIFIYAGSSAVGLFAIQIAKQAGCTVVTTASPHSYDLVKKYGADAVFDYHDANVVQNITKAYPNIARALDCFSEGESTKICAQILKGNGGKVVTLLEAKADVPGVEVKMIMSFQLLGRPFAWLPPIGPKFPASPSEREALVRFYGSLHEWVTEIKTPPITLLEGGFQGILKGLDQLRAKKVSGSKLVVKM
ncbi:GroES-like protein [Plenodomus tracheiphilus IPT5]|uniref:GroES-like protein n=1 Tax=Plenodomus tracheiphilus IPT5 TaxID=1408161 RepID=A0A6A7AXN0_9PLEO|nr:GroES-like protein [Plenodomus tracheiphilus IPT5]